MKITIDASDDVLNAAAREAVVRRAPPQVLAFYANYANCDQDAWQIKISQPEADKLLIQPEIVIYVLRWRLAGGTGTASVRVESKDPRLKSVDQVIRIEVAELTSDADYKTICGEIEADPIAYAFRFIGPELKQRQNSLQQSRRYGKRRSKINV